MSSMFIYCFLNSQAKRTSQQVNMLIPVISDLFCEMKLKEDDTLTRVCEAQMGVVFVELADHKSEQNLSIVDVILLDKVYFKDLIT